MQPPPMGVHLLLCWRPIDHEKRPFHREVVVGTLYNNRDDRAEYWWINGREYDPETHITHWLRLPELPDALENSG